MKKRFAVAILLLSVLLVLPVISGLAAERAETISGVYQPVDTEKAEMSTGVYTVYRAGEEEKEKESPSVAYAYTPARPIAVDYAAVTLIEHYPAAEQIGVKKKVGDSIDFGDGYILLIREINPEVGEVLMQLQLDDHTIDEKIVRIDEYYELAKYNEEPKSIRVIDVDHETTGDYVILVLPAIPIMLVPHLNLIISSVPQWADIHIDGQYVGKTQKTIPFALNTVDFSKMYSLRLVLSGYEDAEQNFQFEPGKEEIEILITLNRIQQTPTPAPPTPMLVPHTHSPTPPPEPTLVPHTYSPSPSIPTPPPAEMAVPHTYSPPPPPSTPEPTPEMAVPHTYSPPPSTPEPTPKMAVPHTTTPPGFLAISFILAILCVYWILKRKHS